MFGTSNTLLIVVEVKNGTIFDDPTTVQKVDRITLDLLHNVPGVNGEQVLSITHPKLKTTLTAGSGIKVVPLIYPRVPEDKEDLEFLRQKVYTTEGVRGLFVSDDDKATQIIAGFWEEYFDLADDVEEDPGDRQPREADGNTKIYVTGPPILFAYFHARSCRRWSDVLAASIVMILLILWFYFRSWQGVVIPTFAARCRAVWGLGFGGAVRLHPRSAGARRSRCSSRRARTRIRCSRWSATTRSTTGCSDKDAAIVKSYIEIYAPAMVSIARRRARDPDAARRAHPAHPEARLPVLVLDHLDLRQRRDAAPDHPLLHAAARGAQSGTATRSSASCRG